MSNCYLECRENSSENVEEIERNCENETRSEALERKAGEKKDEHLFEVEQPLATRKGLCRKTFVGMKCAQGLSSDSSICYS